MKKLLLLLIIILSISIKAYLQTPVDVYVIHQGCPYGITDTWNSQCGAGNMILDSVDYMAFQDLYHFQIPDICYPIQLTMCVYVGAIQPPFPSQNPYCLTQSISNGGAITLIADCSILGIEENNAVYSVYPNPAQDLITIKSSSALTGKSYTIFDQVGKVVLSGQLVSDNMPISLQGLSTGIYVISIEGYSNQGFRIIKE